ncbi:MAG: ChbG/HpnK family deacetylase [Patescibacteria group bacterium UBA2163]
MQHDFITTLDDFGLSPHYDEKIISTANKEKINRVSILPHLYDIRYALPWLQSIPARDIHLTATEQKIRQKQYPPNSISRRAYFILKTSTSGIDWVEREWENQIKEFIALFGSAPDGINSHEHIHFYPPLFKRACNLAEKYNIPFIRLGTNITHQDRSIRGALYNRFHPKNIKHLGNTQCITSTALYSADGHFGEEIASLLPANTEVIVHPDIKNDWHLIT